MASRILVIEHQDYQLENISELLARTEHIVFLAKNHDAGVHVARRQRPDLILWGIAPHSDGLDALLLLRTDASFSDTPIVAVSHFSSPEDRTRLIALGFTGVIGNPLPRDFVSQVEGLLRA